MFRPSCTHKKDKGIQPDIKKLAKATEEATGELLGVFIFAGLDSKPVTKWTKTELGKSDAEKYRY